MSVDFIVLKVDVQNKEARPFCANCVLVIFREFNDLLDCLTSWDLLYFLLGEEAVLLGGVYVKKAAMGTLDYVVLIG